MIEARALEDAQALTVASYLTEWLAHTRGRVRVTTYEGYEGLIRIHAIPRLGQVPLTRLSPLHTRRDALEEVVALLLERETIDGEHVERVLNKERVPGSGSCWTRSQAKAERAGEAG